MSSKEKTSNKLFVGYILIWNIILLYSELGEYLWEISGPTK